MKKITALIKGIFTAIGDCLIPTLPIMVGAGMINVLLIFLSDTVTGILSNDSNTYIVLKFVSDAGFYFLPIYVAFSSARVFKTDEYLAAAVGGTLLSPTFVSLVNEGRELSVFGLKIASTSYGNQIITSIILIWIMSYITRFFDSILHENLKPIFKPLLSFLVMIPICFCIVGPVGVWLSDNLVRLVMLLKKLGPLGNALAGVLIPFIVIGGLGGADLSAMLLLAATGSDEILFYANVLYNSILGFTILPLYLKKKDPETLAAAITATVAGTSEPALFGYAIKDIRTFISLLCGCFFAGLYTGIAGVKSYAMASFGIFGIVTTIGPESSILQAAIAMLVGCITGFALNLILHSTKKKS